MKDKKEMLIVCCILLFAFFLRLYNLENFPRWYVDEGTYAQIGMNIMKGIWGYRTWGPNFFPPLFPLLTGIFITLFGKTYFVIRIIGVLFGLLSIGLTYRIGKELYDEVVGAIAAIILSVSGLFINRMAFMDNLVEFFFLLTILSYIKSEKCEKRLWVVGISAGLAFLSKYTGIVAAIFMVVQSFLDKRMNTLKIPIILFLFVSLVYPLLGIAFGWNEFLFDTLFQTKRKLSHEFLHNFILQPPYYFFYPTFRTFYFWTLLGFTSMFYLLLRKNRNKKSLRSDIILVIAFLSFFFTSILAKNVWWVYLIVIYPIYSLAIGVLIYDAFSTRNILSILLLMIPLVLKLFFDRNILYLITISLLLVSTRLFYFQKRKITTRLSLNLFFLGFVLGSFGYFFFQDILKINENSVQDLRKAVAYINQNVNETEMVASNPNIMWLVDGIGVDYAQMAFYTTKRYTYLYPVELYDRFNMNITLDNFRYVVLDYPKWLKYYIGWSESAKSLTPKIQDEWKLVFHEGNVWVYENSRY